MGLLNVGFFDGTTKEFRDFIANVNKKLEPFGLAIDEFHCGDLDQLTPFLDIQFCFDPSGNLRTDLFVKETDARSYLNFSSCHPNHVFIGIVYSQCLWLRRIIICDTLLQTRLKELKEYLKEAGYPNRMIDNISNKVSQLPRVLKPKTQQKASEKQKSSEPIRVMSTFGCDTALVDTVKKYESCLSQSKSFNNSTTSKPPIFQYVKKTGPSLKNRLVKVKNLALSHNHGCSKPCKARNCKCCKIISPKDEYTINGKHVKCKPGSCYTYNIIYMIVCKCCGKVYIGRTVRQLRTRLGEHRRAFLIFWTTRIGTLKMMTMRWVYI